MVQARKALMCLVSIIDLSLLSHIDVDKEEKTFCQGELTQKDQVKRDSLSSLEDCEAHTFKSTLITMMLDAKIVFLKAD